MIVELRNLTKISLNKWYAGEHWTKRNKLKNDYKLLIKSQFKKVLPKDKQYQVDYTFYFKGTPLDASNCVAMLKLIEDVIFEDDKWNIVQRVSMSSLKDKDERVVIKITEL